MTSLELSGGAAATVADVSRQLAQISKSLASFTEASKTSRNANTLADAVVVQGECPAGLIGCNAAELFEKTGGELSCPPLEMAPDPLIVDHKGRVCYAPDDVREQFRGKNLNLTDLMEKYALKLVKMLESGQNLATAIEVARKGPAGNPIVMNAYVNSPRLRVAIAGILGVAAAAVTEQQISEMAVVLSKFTDKLAPDTGAEVVNLIVNDESGGARGAGVGILDVGRPGAHQQLTSALLTAAIAVSKDQGASYRLAKLLNMLGYVFSPFRDVLRPAGENTAGDLEVQAGNALMFLPKIFRDALVAGGQATSLFALYRFVVFSFGISLGEILAPSKVPEAYCRAIEGLKIAFLDMQAKSTDVKEYAKRKYNGDLGSVAPTAAEDAVYLEAKKGADRMYVARVVEFAKVVSARMGVKFEAPLTAASLMLPNDPKNYLERGLEAAEELVKQLPGVQVARAAGAALILYAAPAGATLRDFALLRAANALTTLAVGVRALFVAAGAAGVYGAFLTTAFRYSRQATSLINIDEDPQISAAQLSSVRPGQAGALADITKQNKKLLAIGDGANVPNVCQVTYRGKPFFLQNKVRLPAGQTEAAAEQAADQLRTRLRALINTGATAGLVAQLAQYRAAGTPWQALQHVSCEPLQNPKDAYTRLHHVLNQASAIDQLYATRTVDAVQPAFYDTGLPAAHRDAYVRLLVALQAMGEPEQVAATLLSIGQPETTSLFVNSVARLSQNPPRKVSVGMRLGGGEGDMMEFEGGEEVEGGEEFEGGEGEEYFEVQGGDDLEDAAEFLLNGGAVPAHQMPKHLHNYLNSQVHGPTNKKEAELKKKLKELGFNITTVHTGKKCPSYARDSNNTFGLPGHKEWVATNSAWPKCMELMGVQFVSEEGFCYPYGMSCYAEDDVTTQTKKTIAKAENWMEMARIYNSVQQKRYEDWLEGEKARIRMEPINANLSEAEVLELAKSHMPPEFKGIPERAAVSTISVVASELAASVNEFTTSNEAAVKAKIRDVLRNGYMRGAWESDDKYAEAQALERLSTKIFEDTKECTDAAFKESKEPPSNPTKFVPGPTKGWAQKCTVEKFPDASSPTGEQEVLIPKEIHAQIDMAALEKGEPPERIVEWWQEYYGKRILEKRKKELELAKKISPFAVGREVLPDLATVQKAKRDESANAILTKALSSALDRDGRRILGRS